MTRQIRSLSRLSARGGLALAVVLLTAFCVSAAPVPPRRPAAAARLAGQLTLDGVLNEAAWQAAPDHTDFEWPLGAASRPVLPSEVQTHFRVLYDDDTLYFGIQCREPKMAELRAEAAPLHDGALWDDDDVEIFFDPVGDLREFYQIAVNSAGTQADLYYIEGGNTGADWSADWRVAVHKGQDYWSLEIALPFAALNMRPASLWADTWAFDLSRTRKPAPSYYSQFSPAQSYHGDPASWGTLGPIAVDKSRYNLSVDNPTFTLSPRGTEFTVVPAVLVENRAATPFEGTLTLSFPDPGTQGSSAPLTLGPHESKRITLPDAAVPAVGKRWCLFEIKAQSGYRALNRMFDRWLNYTPLAIKLTQPSYRNNLYATQQIDLIQGTLALGVPLQSVTGAIARVTLSSSLRAPISIDRAIEKTEIPFELPIADLPVGTYTLRAEILRPHPGQTGFEAFSLVSEAETTLRRLPPAPTVESRLDDQGHLLVNGVPVFIRGWYGSMSYGSSAASLPSADLPHSTNFMMGSGPSESYNTGLYHLAYLNRAFDEAQAQLDTPISDTVKAALREAIAAAQGDRNCLGYYLSDEPECRGLSPVWLQSAYEFIKEQDPYRFVKIVSRAPAQYMQACDLICPHPYMSPLITEDGKRQFGGQLASIHNVMLEAAGANDGSKAVWCMPQVFNYGPPRGQQPSFLESRWSVYTALANGAQGFVPCIYNEYWNDLGNRLGMDALYCDLAFLAPAWMNRDTATAATCDNPQVDVIAKHYRPAGAERGQVYLVAVNQSYSPNQATFTVPQLAQSKSARVLVLRENRVLPVVDGKFTDDFAGLGAHLYTTNEVVPYFPTLDEVEAGITAAYRRAVTEGNLLAGGRLKWAIGDTVWPTPQDPQLVDGQINTSAWPAAPYLAGDRTRCVITLEKPLTFSRLVFHSPTIRDADFDVWENGAWRTVFSWQNNYLYRFEWKGDPVTTTKLRLVPTASRLGYGSGAPYEITEMGLYE